MRPRKPVVSYPKSSKQSACADIHPRNLSLNVPENISHALDKEMYKFLYPSKSSLVQTIICEYFGKEIAYSEIFPEKGRLQLRKPNNSCDRSQLVRITVSINNGLHKKLKLRATNYGITINEVVSAIFHDRYFPELLSDEIYTKKEERYIEIPADKIDEFVVNFVKENLTSPYSPEDKKSKKKKSEKSRYLFLRWRILFVRKDFLTNLPFMRSMKDFIIIGNRAATGGKISLNDLPGSAGRMDVLCRSVTSSLFVSWGMRRDVNVHLVLKGEPDPVKIVRFNGLKMRYLSPDERSSGSLIQKALLLDADETEKSSTPGVFIRKGTLSGLLSEMKNENRKIIYLKEDGADIREILENEPEILKNAVYVLGDNQGVFEEDEKTLEECGALKMSLGPAPLLTSQCITIIQYEMDRIDPPVNDRSEFAKTAENME